MIVRNPIDELEGLEAYELIERGGYHGGFVSPLSDVPPEDDELPRRRIGFRMTEPELPEPESPEWLLL